MKILWSDRALKDLDQIFQFYLELASFEVAQKVTGKLATKVQILESYPELGAIETYELILPFEYRALIEGDYKIIYRQIPEAKCILISRVFDTRRDPRKKNS